MTQPRTLGRVYRCPVCGAEVTVLAGQVGHFQPVCCNQPMQLTSRRMQMYVCRVCGAEVGLLGQAHDTFRPRCCSTDMLPRAA